MSSKEMAGRNAVRLCASGLLIIAACGFPDEVSAPTGKQPAMEAAVAPTDGLVGEWKLDETGGTTAADTKNGYDGTVLGGAAFVTSPLGRALDLNNGTTGTGGKYVDLPSNAVLDAVQENNYTISAWFFAYSVPRDDSLGNRKYTIVGKNNLNMGLLYNADGTFSMKHFLTGDVAVTAASATAPPINTWHHLAGVVSKGLGTVKIFVDGEPQGTTAFFTAGTPSAEYDNRHFHIGKGNANWAADGKVDQVRIYTRALSAAEIDSLYLESSAPPPPPQQPLPIGVFSYNDIGFGPGNDENGRRWGALYYGPSPSTISSDIDKADADSVLLVLTMPGNKGQWRDAAGNFSMQLYEDQLDRFIADSPNARVDQATSDKIENAMTRHRIVCIVIDEPNLNNEMSPNQVAQMAAEYKARWPTCLTFARITPSLLKAGWGPTEWRNPTTKYPKLDYAWSQYNNSLAKSGMTPKDVWNQERAAIQSAGYNMGLAVSLNIWAGGIFQTTDGQAPCWDYADNNSSSGYVLGDRDDGSEGTRVPCSQLGSTVKSVIASPAWIRHFAQQVAADGGFPFMLMWNKRPLESGQTSIFDQYYIRNDFVSAFDDAIQTGDGAQAAAWRQPN